MVTVVTHPAAGWLESAKNNRLSRESAENRKEGANASESAENSKEGAPPPGALAAATSL